MRDHEHLPPWAWRLAPWSLLLVLLGAAGSGRMAAREPAQPTVPADHAAKMTRGLDVFTKQVRPLLLERCVKCHGGDKTKGDFDLTTRETLLRGGSSGPAVVAGKARDSRLYKLVTHQEDPPMPAQGTKLKDEQIAQLALWIDLGAPYDRPLVDKSRTARRPMIVTEEDRQFWSFRPLQRPALPSVQNAAWCQTPIDYFILAKLEEQGLAPNPPADRRKLLRRAYFDLIGLPPTPEEVEAFVHDPAPDAYEKRIDGLLNNPHFGERWARHWLDLARFAESHGFEHDYDRPTAYHYRDFVIKAFNQDLPYDTFVKWQIAGDELAPDNPLALMATGFLAAGVHSTQITKNQVEKERYDELDDMARTLGTAMLGLTIGCARCHDHKYDPIPTRDYYRLLSTFTTTVRSEMDLDLDPRGYQQAKAKFDAEHAQRVGAFVQYEAQELAQHFEQWRAASRWRQAKLSDRQRRILLMGYRLFDPGWRQLAWQVIDHHKHTPKPSVVKALISSEGVKAVRLHTQGGDYLKETHFLKRGDPNQKEDVATQSFLQVLMRSPEQEKHWQVPPPSRWRTSYRRRALADWLTDADAGAGHLLARVIVNRLWQHHLGRGLIGTPSDFGFQGERPTHPELLDWLATELIHNGWRLKPIHKLIQMSAVAMQSAAHDPQKAQADPDNRWCWRRTPQRLEAEIIRDALLAVSGSLEARMFGPGTLDEGQRRRSIYFFVKRSKLIPTMLLFDAPDALQGIERRPTTTVAPQALLLMNNPVIRGYAESFARRIHPRADTPLADAVRSGYLATLGRQPSDTELADAVQFIQQETASYQADGQAHARSLALADFCQVLMSLNEFVYID